MIPGFCEGSSVSGSRALVNAEVLAAAIYTLFSAVVTIAHILGVDIQVSGEQMHQYANWTTTLYGALYTIYRTVTNPHAGVSVSAQKTGIVQE